MRVLIGCEFSGTVRNAFIAQGHDAVSCDLLPTENPGPHIQGDILSVLDQNWDIGIFHPPCTFLTVSANKWMGKDGIPHPKYPNRAKDREDAVQFFMALYNSPIPRVAVENPIGVMSSRFRKPDQIIQPFNFGHAESKATCLWLRELPPLMHTLTVPLPSDKRLAQRLHHLPKTPDRWKLRSTTYQGIADAMAVQWGLQS